MTAVWNKIEELALYIESQFKKTGTPQTTNIDHYAWYNALYTSSKYRRAHLEIVDNRESYGIYILHCTIFPHFNDPSPIWGFDAVCGKNKITGAFHDFSSAGDSQHELIKWFGKKTEPLTWNKPRDLPDWARRIFSPHMVAAGNVQEGQELDDLCNLAKTSLDHYLESVGDTQESLSDYHMAQNRYCYWQKQNPHVVKSMVAMGVEEAIIEQFVDEVLFPEAT